MSDLLSMFFGLLCGIFLTSLMVTRKESDKSARKTGCTPTKCNDKCSAWNICDYKWVKHGK